MQDDRAIRCQTNAAVRLFDQAIIRRFAGVFGSSVARSVEAKTKAAGGGSHARFSDIP